MRQTAGWAAALVLASWAELNSGTVKEAYMQLLSMHGCGAFIISSCRKTQGTLEAPAHRPYGDRILSHSGPDNTYFLAYSEKLIYTLPGGSDCVANPTRNASRAL